MAGGLFGGFIGGFMGGVAGGLLVAWTYSRINSQASDMPTWQRFRVKKLIVDANGTQLSQYLQPNNTFGGIDTALEMNKQDSCIALAYFKNAMPNSIFSSEPITQTVNGNGY